MPSSVTRPGLKLMLAENPRLRRIAAAVVARSPAAVTAPNSAAGAAVGAPRELAVEDFRFDGPLGSAGTTLRRVGPNHFVAALGEAPGHPEWGNKIQFTIDRHALGNTLRLDVEFPSPAMSLNEYFASYSYDGRDWRGIDWEVGRDVEKTRDTLVFPTFEHGRVLVGHQVPMSYEDSIALMENWCVTSPALTRTEVLGQSLGGRDIVRLEVASSDGGSVPRSKRWVHYISNQQ